MEEITKKKFSELPEHTQMFLQSKLADVNYLKGFYNDPKNPHYMDAESSYEKACLREGVTPYVQE